MRWENCTGFPHYGRKAIRVNPLSIFPNLIIYTNPVAAVQTVSLIFNPTWINAIALVVTIVGSFTIGPILRHFHDSHIWWKQIINDYFHKFNDCYFEPTTIEELEGLEQSSEDTWGLIRSGSDMALFLSPLLKPRFRAFYVYPKGRGGPLIRALKAYPMASTSSFVFVPPENTAPQEQLPEEFREIEKGVRRFFLLHEIGHASAMHITIDMWVWAPVANFCLLLVFVVCHREVGIPALLVVLALAIMWGYCFLQQQGNRKERVELVADAFALVHLARRPDFRTTIARIALTSRKQSKFWHYRARLLVRRAQILNRTESAFSLRWEGGHWLREILLPVPLWLTLLFFAVMLWLGATLSITDWKELGVSSFLWLIGPASWHYYYMFVRAKLPGTARARREAIKFLQAHAPPDLPVERQVKSVFDLI